MLEGFDQTIKYLAKECQKRCPACGHWNSQPDTCTICGLIFSRYKEIRKRKTVLSGDDPADNQPLGHFKKFLGKMEKATVIYAMITLFIVGALLWSQIPVKGEKNGIRTTKETETMAGEEALNPLFKKGKRYFENGIISAGRRDIVGAARGFEETLKIFNRLGNKRLIAITNLNLAGCYSILKKTSASLTCFKNTEDISRENGFAKFEALALRGAALVYYYSGRHGTALAYLEEAFTIHRGFDNREAISDCLIMGAIENEYYPYRGVAYFKKALEISRVIGDPMLELKVRRLSKISLNNGSQMIKLVNMPPHFENL